MFSNDLRYNLFEKTEISKKKLKRFAIFGIISIFIIILIIVIVSSSAEKENQIKPEEEKEKTKEKELPEADPKEIKKYYSETTKNYLNFIENLEKDNLIAYHFSFDNDYGMKNTYQHIYSNTPNSTYNSTDNDTSLSFNDTFFNGYFLSEQITSTKQKEELQFYANHPNQYKPQHFYVLGPSSILSDYYIDGQRLISPSNNIRINPKEWGGFSYSFKARALNGGNRMSGLLSGWGSFENNKISCGINVPWGMITYRCGKKNVSTGERIFYNNQYWHLFVVTIRKAEKDDIKYISGINEGDYFTELFIDGISKINTTLPEIYDDYGDFHGFSFSNDFSMNSNENFYLDDIFVFKKGLKLKDVLILNSTIVQPTEHITPIKYGDANRCNMPGVKFGPFPWQVYNESKTDLNPEIKFLHLTEKWSFIGIDYNQFFIDRMDEYCGTNLRKVDLAYANGSTEGWYQRNIYIYDFLDIFNYYFPKIFNYLHNLTSFSQYLTISSTDLNEKDLQKHEIINYGSYLNSEGALRISSFQKNLTGNTQIGLGKNIYYAYFEIKGGYKENRKYTIKLKGSKNKESFIYDEKKLISHAIKVNQVGYAPIVNQHFAYIGRWLGTFGELPLEKYFGKKFYIYDSNNNKKFEGTITWRSQNDLTFVSSVSECPLNGEQTLLLDFSNITFKGDNFYIYIPGIGRSFSFSISNKGVFKSFYTVFRGFFHQRTGAERKKPYTNWEMGAHHKGIYVAHHIPNNGHYSKYITNDRNGELLKDFNQFDMIDLTKTDEYWEEVYGGHADAGDFDNRPFHLGIVLRFAAIWFKKKDILKDNQFNIPDGGNGVPDLIKEMEWQLRIHYQVQQRFGDGSVSTWIEATSHPQYGGDPGDDPQRYYVGLRTREDTMGYVIAAGTLALVYESCETCDKKYYQKWKNSTEWAWNWAIQEKNKCKYSFIYKNESYTYNEPDLDECLLTQAALIMYKLTGKTNKTFEKYFFRDKTKTKGAYDKYTDGLIDTTDGLGRGPFTAFPAIFYLDDPDFELYIETLRGRHYNGIKPFLELQNNGTQYTYRNAHVYPYNHGYYSSLGWGVFMGSNRLEYIAIGLYIYENEPQDKYPNLYERLLQSLSYYYDFNLGCNHWGRTFTTGLGAIYPIKFLSFPNGYFNYRGIDDPIPGISIYFFTGVIHYQELNIVQRLNKSNIDFYNFKGIDVYPSPFFFNETGLNKSLTYDEAKTILSKKLPFWHRTTNIEGQTVSHSEFTVSETMARMTMMVGLLLDKDERSTTNCDEKSCPSIFPTQEMKDIAPKNITNLITRWQVP